jgi:hypothetical protein
MQGKVVLITSGLEFKSTPRNHPDVPSSWASQQVPVTLAEKGGPGVR